MDIWKKILGKCELTKTNMKKKNVESLFDRCQKNLMKQVKKKLDGNLNKETA